MKRRIEHPSSARFAASNHSNLHLPIEKNAKSSRLGGYGRLGLSKVESTLVDDICHNKSMSIPMVRIVDGVIIYSGF